MMHKEMEKKLYTLLIYSENIAGILSQVAAVFTRQQVNIESINVSASSIRDIHKYTITAYSDEDQIKKITKQIERKIDVVKADYYVDEDLFIHEIAIYKISAPILMQNPEISRVIRHSGARMMEVNPVYATVQIAGLTDEVTELYKALDSYGCVLQYSRSGRVAVTRSVDEPVSEYLNNNTDTNELRNS